MPAVARTSVLVVLVAAGAAVLSAAALSPPDAGANGPLARLYGRIILREGDCQPAEVGIPGSCRSRPVARRIFLYEPPLRGRHFRGTYYTGSRTPMVVVRSNARGLFRADVMARVYSALVEDRRHRYCNRFTQVLACPVTLRSGHALRHNLVIDHSSG